MIKLKIKITESTDISKELDKLNRNCSNKGILKYECEQIIHQVRSNVFDLAKRGHELMAIGSQFQIKRVFNTDNVEVKLNLDFGRGSGSIKSKLLSLFSNQ